MELIFFGQLLEIITVLLLLMVQMILYRFGGIKYINDLRIAFFSYFILIVITLIDPFSNQLILDGLFKYMLLSFSAVYIYRSFSNREPIYSKVSVFYLLIAIAVLIPIVLIGIGRPEILEGIGYVLFGITSILVGLFWMKHILSHLLASKIVGVTFILFGLHMMDFIFFQYTHFSMTIGYMVAAAFEAIIALLLVFLNFAYLKELDDIAYSKYTNLFNNASDAIFLIKDDIIFDCNEKAQVIFERSKEHIIGHKPMELSETIQENGRDAYQYAIELFESASEGKVTCFNWVHISGSGKKIMCEVSLFKIETNQFAAIIRDMTSKYVYEEEINFHKYYDTITHLPKRELFIDRLSRFLDERPKKIALIAFNIDNFKEINDEYGHEVGDEILRQVAERANNAFKKEITLTRLGGDEFVVIMDKLIHKNRIYIPVERIQTIFDKPFEVNEQQLTISACLGVAFPVNESTKSMELLKNVDLALNIAKGKGRGRLEFYSEEEKEVFAKRISIERDMRSGIEMGEFIPFYQPIINPHTGEIIGAEALARWILKDGSMIYPDIFIPIAEETELIRIIGKQILFMACEDCKALLENSPDFVIHVNLSPLQLYDDSIIHVLKEAMEQYQVTARHIAVELTEAVFIEDVRNANNILKQIRAMGIGVALDDFGTGYSSLSYLTSMEVDVIKIDRSFVVKLPGDHKSRFMMEYLTDLLHNLGYKLVVEGVEEHDQADYLIDLGCDAIQGYYYHRPMVFEQLKALLL